MIGLYINGLAGNKGTKVLIKNKYLELSKYFNNEFLDKVLVDLNGGASPPLFFEKKIVNYDTFKRSLVDKENIKKGGLLSALWKLCDRNKIGIVYSLMNIPLNQGTIEISNYFDLNPYRLLTENAEIALIDCDKICADKIVSIEIEQYSKSYDNINYNENVIYNYFGKATNNKKRIRIDNDIESYLTKDYKDEIDKILINYTRTI